jgi:methyl-accepting chemotaxis protein
VEQSSLSMQDIASSVQKSSNEQANTANHISTNIEKVSQSTTQINHALDGQAQACAQVAGFLDGMLERNRRSEDAVSHLDITMRELRAEAESLREAMGHFEHSGEDQERAEPQDPA